MCDPAFCLSALRIMCTASHTYSVLLSPASTVCVRPARRPSGHCHARPSARVSSTGLETQGPEASLLLLQRNLVYAPLRSAHHRGPSQLAGSFFKAVTKKTCRRREFLLSPGGCFFAFFAGYGGAASSILPRRARARASMWHAGPRIGDGYRKLSLTPTSVPNES